jgi:hypothetical protein
MFAQQETEAVYTLLSAPQQPSLWCMVSPQGSTEDVHDAHVQSSAAKLIKHASTCRYSKHYGTYALFDNWAVRNSRESLTQLGNTQHLACQVSKQRHLTLTWCMVWPQGSTEMGRIESNRNSQHTGQFCCRQQQRRQTAPQQQQQQQQQQN